MQSLTSLNSYAEAIKGSEPTEFSVSTPVLQSKNICSTTSPRIKTCIIAYVPDNEIDDIPFIDEDGN